MSEYRIIKVKKGYREWYEIQVKGLFGWWWSVIGDSDDLYRSEWSTLAAAEEHIESRYESRKVVKHITK